ncbi:MAG: radical SAM protein [Bacteroidales bacterium]|nr:radical SAM protein [Bacteroidales bacterium]
MTAAVQKKVYISCNGCNRRLLDAQRLKNYLLANGYEITGFPGDADYLVFFASALNKVRIDESFDIIRKLGRYKGEIIVLGCLMETAPTEFNAFWKGKALPVKDMDDIDLFFPDIKVPYKEIPPDNFPLSPGNIYKDISPGVFIKQRLNLMLSPLKIADKLYGYLHHNKKEDYNTTFIWVSKGCPNLCSFCAERRVVGPCISRPAGEIVNEYSKLLEAGKRNFEFIGDDVGSYGLDLGITLPHLIQQLNKADKDYQVNWVIKHLHPKFIIRYKNEFIEMASSGKIRELICCFQSGSNRVLKLMRRQHTIEEVIDTLKEFRKVLPEIRLATNIIVGFPTETGEDFMKTLHVYDKVYFDRVHIIKYYDAEGSDSYAITPKVTDHEIARRIKLAKRFFKKRGIYFQTRD